MPLNLLVSKTDNITVQVYCWKTINEDIEATHIKSEIPKDVEMEEFKFTFRKPNYADSNIIIRNSNFKTSGEDTSLDVNSFQENILRALLIDWNLQDETGKKVPVNTVSINSLAPSVARSSVSGVLDVIKI